MANLFFRLPPINPHKFVEYDVPSDPRFAQGDFDKDWFCNGFVSFQNRIPYTRKMARLDPVTLAFDCSAGSASIEVWDSSFNVVATGLPYYLNGYAGNYADDGVTTLLSYLSTFCLYDYTNAYGTFYLVINKDNTGKYPRLISEPINLRHSWADTAVVTYRDDKLNFDVPFNLGVSPAFYFFLRVDGFITNYQPLSTDVNYEDEDYQLKSLYGAPYRTFDFKIGGYRGAPDYDVDRLNRAILCKNFFVNGKRFVKQTGSKFQLTKADDFPYGTASVTMREGDQARVGVWSNAPIAKLYKVPFATPYVIDSLTMKDATTGAVVTLANLLYVDSAATQSAFFDGANAGILISVGLKGYFGVSGSGYFCYINGDGESFAPFVSLVYNVSLNLYLENNALVPNFNYTYVSTAQHVIAWSNGGAITLERKAASATGSATHTFPNNIPPTQKIAMIFHAPNAIQQIASNGGSYKKVVLITGNVPLGFQTFTLQNFAWLDGDLNFLRNAVGSLVGVSLVNGGMRSLDTSIFLLSGWTNTVNAVYVDNNSLSSVVVDKIFNNVALPTVHANGAMGEIETQGQSPSAPPTTTSATARATLTTATFTIVTD